VRAWFERLPPREQLAVLALGLVLAVYSLYMAAWAPLAERRAALAGQNSAIAGSLTRVDALVSELAQLRDSDAQPGAQRNLLSLINQSTSRLQLPVSRLQPNSRGEIQVRLENAPFDDLLGWLYELEYGEGLLVREVSIVQAGVPGRVNVTVRIAQAG